MEIEIINYIKEAEKHGLSEQEIKKNLLNAGWEASLVEEAFAHTKAIQNQPLSNKDEDMNLPKKPAFLLPSQPAPQKAIAASFSPTASPAIKFPSENFSSLPAGNKKPFSKTLAVLAVAAGLLLAGGAFGYYQFVYVKALPAKIWDKFTQQKSETIYTNQFTLGYSDKGSYEGSEIPGNFELKDLKLDIDGTLYLNTSETKNLASQSDVKYSFSTGTTTFSTGFGYRLVNQVLYLNVGDNQFLNSLISLISKEKKIQWLSIDISKIGSKTGEIADKDTEQLKQTFNEDLQNDLKKMWADARFIKINSFVGKETIDKTAVYHFKNELDKEALKQFITQALDKISESSKKSGAEVKDDQVAAAKQAVTALVDKIQVKEFDTWISGKNYRLYKIHLLTNAPSVINTVKLAASELKKRSDDTKRLEDIRKMSTALELFRADYGGYPEGLNGVPQGMENYLSPMPEPPKPASGACNDYYNNYWYQPMGQKRVLRKTVYEKFEINFCLGFDNGSFAAGFRKLSPAGIGEKIPCPGQPNTCPAEIPQLTASDKVALDIIKLLDFSAEFRIDSTYSGFGEKKDVVPPENSTDILELFKNFLPQASTSTTPSL